MSKLFKKQEKNMDSEWTIFWAKRAKISYFMVLDYLSENWSKKEVLQFVNRVDVVLKAIEKNPQMYVSSSKNQNVRRAIVDKNNSLFYSINTDQKRLIVLTFYDNRQDPKKFKVI